MSILGPPVGLGEFGVGVMFAVLKLSPDFLVEVVDLVGGPVEPRM